MVWIALTLLLLTVFVVYMNAQAGRWSMGHWRWPPRKGPTYSEHLAHVELLGRLPHAPAGQAIHHAAWATYRAVVLDGSGFFVFSNFVVFGIFTTFLLPLWTLSFATEGLGREREARNLIWLLTRPLSRAAIYLAKFLAAVPWCLALTLGGFALICMAAGSPGRLALRIYWPAVVLGTLAFCALFHLMGVWFRRPAVVAILYSFFLETVMGNLPGHFKRLSVSYYTRCAMFDRAHDWGIYPERPATFLPVSGTLAVGMLAGVTLVALLVGIYSFSRREYLDVG